MSAGNDFQNDDVEAEFDLNISNSAGINPVFLHRAREQMQEMTEQILKTNLNLKGDPARNVKGICKTDQSVAVKAGFVAEEIHAETFNLDAILKRKSTRAYTDRQPEFQAPKNGIPDIQVLKDGEVIGEAQVKYYKDAKTTETQMRELNPDGKPKYDGLSLIGPSEQVGEIKKSAQRTQQKEAHNRPAVANSAKMVEDNASGTLQADDITSAPLSKKNAEAIAKNPDAEARTSIENTYKTKSTLQNMGEAAAGAAAMASIVSGSIAVVRYTNMVREGKIDASEAVIKIATQTVVSATDSAIKAAVTTGGQSLIIRYGSEELARKMAGKGVGALLRSNAVSVAAVCSIDLIKDIVLFGAGKITAAQLEERTGKNILATSAGTLGGSLGALACGGLAGTGGALAAAAVPIIGGLAGALICSMAMDAAIENGIEAPYRDLVSNTRLQHDSACQLTEVSQKFYRGQVNFERFLIVDAEMDQKFKKEAARGAISMDNMRAAIDRI